MRTSVTRISRTIDTKASRRTSSVMGSIIDARSSRSRIRLPCSSTAPAQPGGITVVAPNSSTMAGPARRARSGSRSRSHTGQSMGAPSNQIGRRSTSASSSEAVALR